MPLNHLLMLLKKYPEKPWNWDLVSSNPNITLYDILYHIDHPNTTNRRWNWDYLSSNPNITIDDMKKFPLKILKKSTILKQQWSFNGLSRNPNITYQFVLDHPDTTEERTWGDRGWCYQLVDK